MTHRGVATPSLKNTGVDNAWFNCKVTAFDSCFNWHFVPRTNDVLLTFLNVYVVFIS